jgi:outer membrane lipoprotein SlyB
MKALLVFFMLLAVYMPNASADYDRNQAVPVEKVLFGSISSVRQITETELTQDRNQDWKVFGSALIGGSIGNQFGSGNGRALSTILGAILGGTMANNSPSQSKQITIQLVELMISTDNDGEYMVVQDFDPAMRFQAQDKIRMIYLANGFERIDKQY